MGLAVAVAELVMAWYAPSLAVLARYYERQDDIDRARQAATDAANLLQRSPIGLLGTLSEREPVRRSGRNLGHRCG
jgi:hypothetical protein